MSEKPISPDDAKEDEFLASLRIDQSYTDATVGVRKVLMTVPVRKPMKTEFFRVHPEHWLDCHVVEMKLEREHYFVLPEVAPVIAEFVEPVRLRYLHHAPGHALPVAAEAPEGRSPRQHLAPVRARSCCAGREELGSGVGGHELGCVSAIRRRQGSG